MSSNAAKARAEYEATRRDIETMLRMAKAAIELHAEKAAADGETWGHVGDLQHVRQQMRETLVFLSGAHDEEAAEKAINEAVAAKR